MKIREKGTGQAKKYVFGCRVELLLALVFFIFMYAMQIYLILKYWLSFVSA